MRWLVASLLLALCLCAGVVLHTLKAPPPVQAGISLQEALSDDSRQFAEVLPGRRFEFPADHGPHREFKTEWWYFTGNLEGAQGEEFGYQLTIFRVGVTPRSESSQSRWAGQELYMGHLALSRIKTSQFVDFERLSRDSLGLAGAEQDGRRLWLEDWEIARTSGGWNLKAQASDKDVGPVGLRLQLSETKPPVLQGEGGYSRKGPLPRQASYYVSQTRLDSKGQVTFGDETFAVQGTSWFDHEWSSEAMAPGLVGWDWFSLQLSDQTELMIYLLRYKDGRLEPASSGSLVTREGSKVALRLHDFSLQTLERNRVSSGKTYPSLWRLTLPKENLVLKITPKLAEQEVQGTVPYWEGAVEVSGTRGDQVVKGEGFVELTGY